MNDEMMRLFFRLEYAVQTMRRRQKAHGVQDEMQRCMREASEEMVDDLLLRLEAARERPPQEAGGCV